MNVFFMVRVFANGPGPILGWVIPKTQKMVLDPSLLNTQYYKVRIKGKVEQSREKSSALPYTLVTEKGAFGSPSTMVTNFILLLILAALLLNKYMCVCVCVCVCACVCGQINR